MSSITGISASRISDTFVNYLLTNQVQYDESQLTNLETELSTGDAFQLPGQNPTAANQVVNLQNLVARKTQLQTNLTTGQSFLSATDSALSNVNNLLNDASSTATSVIGTTATDAQRTAAAEQINQIIQQLVNTGNQQFDGRYLFSGSETAVQPFNTLANGDVQYAGDSGSVSTYGDVNLLFATNVSGAEAFGALSPAVATNTLTPALTPQTSLSDLREGAGISAGSIAISDGHSTSIVDLRGAATIGDVAAMIAANPPAGRSLSVQVTATGLQIQLNPVSGADPSQDNLSIQEVGGGDTASNLGILNANGVGDAAIVGEPLNPTLDATTPLSNLLGTEATAEVDVPGQNSNFSIQATSNGNQTADGTLLNGVTLAFQGDAAAAGDETVDFAPGTATTPGQITVHIKPGQSSVSQVVAAINNAAQLHEIPFTASLDPTDRPPAGTAPVPVSTTAQTTGGSGTVFDTSGLQITNGGQTYNISFAGATTVQDVLDILNSSGAGVDAQINADKSGISIQSTVSGNDFTIGENGGQTATQLGVRTFDADTALSSLNYGAGVGASTATGNSSTTSTNTTAPDTFSITMADGTSFNIDVSSAKTIGDVEQLINAAGGSQLNASLATTGNGLVLTDTGASPGPITVTEGAGSTAAEDLGLIPMGQETVTSSGAVLNGSDANPMETSGMFNALVRLSTALQSNDATGIDRAMGLLQQSTTQLSFVRADLGAREQGVTAVQDRLTSEQTELATAISSSYGADLTQVISDFTAEQASFQGALKVAATTMQVSLLNYI